MEIGSDEDESWTGNNNISNNNIIAPEFPVMSTPSTKGRKKTTAAAPSLKAALNREAQRALRERKAKYQLELETKVSELGVQNTALMQTIADLRNKVDVLERKNLNLEQLLQANSRLSTPGIAANNVPTQSSCISCNAERIKAIICMDQIKVLEAHISAISGSLIAPPAQQTGQSNSSNLQQRMQLPISNMLPVSEPPNLFHSNLDSMFGFSNSSSTILPVHHELLLDYMDNSIINWNSLAEITNPETQKTHASNNSVEIRNLTTPPMTSEQLYGPIEVESFKITMKCFDSLRNHQELVDNWFDLFQAQSKVSNSREARRLMVKLNHAGRKMFSVASQEEWPKFNELFSIYHQRNVKHE
ncbi:hypothetical protein HK100_004634, partial [Physocladia obscura]